MHVPVIDLTRWDTDRDALVAEVDAACREVGFLQVVGHGIDREVIDAMLDAGDRFFALALDEKLRCVPPSPGINRGYAAIGSEALAYSLGVDDARPDLFEAFNVGPDQVDRTDPFYANDPHAFFAENVWPERPAALRAAVNGYFAEAHRVALHLTEVFALALGLPEGWFRPFVDRSTATMRVIHYELRPTDPDPEPAQMWMGAHTDYGMVTVLFADPVPGLQILGHDGAWHDVLPAPGALLVNLGDLTAHWTNDRWRSTLHRVVPPPRTAGGSAVRRSTAFFLDANYDAVVECLPTCVSDDRPVRYQPVTAGEHLIAKVLGPRELRSTEGVVLDTVRERLDAV
jgi:isopenicillin N synthase-like dioxygenase